MNLRVAAALAVLTTPAAAGNIKLGPAKLDLHYGFETRYEDNIYRVPKDENGTAVAGGGVRGSWIFSNNVGLKVGAPVGRHKVWADYDATFENYTTQPKANDAVNQRAGGAWEYNGSKIDARAYDSYLNTYDPQFNPNNTAVIGDLVRRERRWQNNAGAQAEYGLGDKFFFGVDGDWMVQRYSNRDGGSSSLANLLNRSEVLFGFKTGYKVQPKTRVYVAGHRKLVHYTEETRQDHHKDWIADAGVEGEITGKLKGRVQTGLEYRDYDADSSNPTRPVVARLWRVQTDLEFKLHETCQWLLSVVRALNESSTAQSRYYTSTGVNLGMNHKLGAKLTAGLNGGYQHDRYAQTFTIGSQTKVRRDHNYQAGARADYKFNDWLAAGLTYTHNRRQSSFTREFNYRDNITGANLRLTF